MKESKRVLGFRVDINDARFDGIRKLEIVVRPYSEHNAAEEVANAIKRGNERDQQIYLKRANAVRQPDGDTRYFDRSAFGPALTFRWQDDPQNGTNRWYAGSVELDNADADCFAILAKIVKSVGHAAEIGPRALVQGLQAKLGALPLSYVSGEHYFVRDAEFNLDAAIPAAELPSEPDVSAELDPEAEELLEHPEAAEAA